MSNSIKLPPIRMSDIKTPVSPGTTESPTQVPRSRYTPPAKRAAVSEPVITSLDFSSNAFPSLDNSPVSVKSPVVGGFKQKILDLIAKDALDEAERKRIQENDPEKMSRQELINAGWAFLPLGNMKETVVRLNERLEKIKQYKNPSDQGFM